MKFVLQLKAHRPLASPFDAAPDAVAAGELERIAERRLSLSEDHTPLAGVGLRMGIPRCDWVVARHRYMRIPPRIGVP